MAAPHSDGAAAPGLAAPERLHKDEDPGRTGTEVFKGLAQRVSFDSRSPDPWPQGPRATALMLGLLLLTWLLGDGRPR